MSGPSIHFTLPDRSLFKFPPDSAPQALPPPNDESTWKSPFPIPADIYNGALDIRVPMYIGGTYVVLVTLINAYNRRNGNRPWWIATTRPFKLFVILHNIFLAVYSGLTFAAMTRAADHAWPGFDNSNGLAGVADALCKMQGPRGLGDAVTFNSSTTAWDVKNSLINVMPGGTPDPTDVGRLWNEGLAFWGWLFYLSKFYEVLDTFVIVAKGKRSATLQTYHHAGAMLCMWAGIRYMSPPIWMFVWVNSAIHTMMYTYFTLSALGIRVPMVVKRALTTMQITQFLFGASFAAIHLFVKYDIPIATAYKISHPVSSALAAATSTVSSVAASATSVVEPAVQTFGVALLKRFLLRAAGEEGVAENVRDPVTGHAITPEVEEAVQRYHEETRWRTDYTTVNCIDTTGQSFAIWLNLIYLAPLTALFVRFFVRAYTARGRAKGAKHSSKAHKAERAAIEAAKGVDREVDIPEKAIERGIDKVVPGSKKISGKNKDLSEEVKRDLQALKDGKLGKKADAKTSDIKSKAQSYESKASDAVEDIKNEAKVIKDEVEDELRGPEGALSGSDDEEEHSEEDQRPSTSDSKASDDKNTSSPSQADKKKKRKNKKKNKQASSTADITKDEPETEKSETDEKPVVGEGKTAAVQLEGKDEESLKESAEKVKEDDHA